MKKTVKKLTAVGLTLTSVMSLVACGNSNNGGRSYRNIRTRTGSLRKQ